MNREWSKRVIGASGAIFLFVGVWWLASLILQKTLLPSPWAVFVNIPSLFQKEMGLHIQVSGYRIFFRDALCAQWRLYFRIINGLITKMALFL